nr:flagellar hook-length control protein FliK [uncultured Dongia sp.]
METTRIDNFLSLASKNTTARADPGAAAGGFADMLFGAMSQHSDAIAAAQSQVRSTQSYPSSFTPRRRFDDLPVNSVRFDDRLNAVRDQHADDKTGRVAQPEGIASSKTDQPMGDHLGRMERKLDLAHKSGGDDLRVSETEAGDAIDSAEPTESTAESDLTEDGLDLALGSENGDSEAGTNQDDAANPDTDIAIAICGTAVPDELVMVAAPSAAVAPQVAVATAATGDAKVAVEDIDQAAALVAAATLPELANLAGPGEEAMPAIAIPASPTSDQDGAADTIKPAVTFGQVLSASEGSDAAPADGQAAALTAENERRLEDAGSSFRRNPGAHRRATPVSQGATGNTAQANQTNATTPPDLHAATIPNGMNAAAGSAPALSGLAPAGFDTGFGNAMGLPGWNLNLAQGAAARRGDFVANLRQHLQNLPVHDQVALSIQRSVRDGGGSITLQLSPTELGRIHLKLNIDEENNVQAAVVVERPATLELLQRDMKALERALQDAGLKAGPGDLSFSLQGGDAEAFARDFGSGNGTGSGGSGRGTDDGVEDIPTNTAATVIATGDGWVDVQV